MEKTKAIFSLRVASLLARRGHDIIERRPNINEPKFDVFYFEDNESFQDELDKIMEEIRK